MDGVDFRHGGGALERGGSGGVGVLGERRGRRRESIVVVRLGDGGGGGVEVVVGGGGGGGGRDFALGVVTEGGTGVLD